MRYLLLINLILISPAYSLFRSSDCINNDFEANVNRKGAVFGMLNYRFNISKDRCVIKLAYKDVLKSDWTFDICREPVHLKVNQYLSEKVYIKSEDCNAGSKNTFCRKSKEFFELIEKEGLINAQGERDSLSTEHGKVYCVFKLLKKHLEDEVIFTIDSVSNPSLFETSDLMDVLPKKETIEKKIEVVKEAVVEKAKKIKDNIKEGVSETLEKAGEKLDEAKKDLESF